MEVTISSIIGFVCNTTLCMGDTLRDRGKAKTTMKERYVRCSKIITHQIPVQAHRNTRVLFDKMLPSCVFRVAFRQVFSLVGVLQS